MIARLHKGGGNYMEKKKIVKKILVAIVIIIALLIVIFMVRTIINYSIITGLQNKILDYSGKTNYYTKSVSTKDDGTIVTMRYYKKDSKQAVFLETSLDDKVLSKVSMYDNGERTDVFTETQDSKVVQLDSIEIAPVEIYNYLENDNNWQTFIGSIFAKVKSTDYKDKKCYVVEGFQSSKSLSFDGAETYIEKDTGLCIKTTEGEMNTEKEYEFDNVDDSIFVEPDIGQYKIQDN